MIRQQPHTQAAASATSPAAAMPSHEMLGVPLALTDYDGALDWMDALVARASAATSASRPCTGDGRARTTRELRRACSAPAHGARRQPLVWARTRSAGAAGPRLRARADGALLRPLRASTGTASTSTAAATRARSSSSRCNLRRRYPGPADRRRLLAAVPRRSPTRRRTRVADEINRSGADVVWVGIGVPKQEKWMARMRDRLDAPVLVGVGAAFDFHAGLVPQAPRLDAAPRPGVGVPARAGAAPPVAALPALQPALRASASPASTLRHALAARAR